MERILLWSVGLACVTALLLAAPGVAVAGAKHQATCTAASATVHDRETSRSQAREALLCLLNAERGKRGIRPLAEDPRLRTAALAHARWMVRNRCFSHYRPGGPDLVTRLRKVDYIPRSGPWLVGENIGYGLPRRSSPADQVRFWMSSPMHRANILNPRFQAAGLGIFSGTPKANARSRGATYAVDFGSRR